MPAAARHAAVCLVGIPNFFDVCAPYLREHLFEPLDADVFAYVPWAAGATGFDARLLGPRLVAVRREVENISERFRAAAPQRWWSATARIKGNWLGCWVPHAGAPRREGAGLCIAYGGRRCLEMISAHERSRAARYRLVVQSRPDLLWKEPHPLPAHFAGERTVWVPEGHDWGGLNDRHAVMGRDTADAYLGGGWSDLLSGAAARLLLRRLGPRQALNCSPAARDRNGAPESALPCATNEMWLALRLAAGGVRVVRFTSSADVLKARSAAHLCGDASAALDADGPCLQRLAVLLGRELGLAEDAADELDVWRRLQRWCSLHKRDKEHLGGDAAAPPQVPCEALLVDLLLAEASSRQGRPCVQLLAELRRSACSGESEAQQTALWTQ
uniref:DUF7796 domain-containing protein n=1 Tax=Alexandrium monilatum TaxID=311494 RepID=A0A7S4V5H1_9DINO|mmetsp:Transcript_48168/g.151267  ORF Transcript_48168/g.151267 Transcript_48168/m.151267 type:complete len:386 (-) Transcript_48168:34-1191(-)